MGTEWTLDEIIAEARRLRTGGGNPHNAHQDLQTVLAMIEALAGLVKPQAEQAAEIRAAAANFEADPDPRFTTPEGLS